MKGDGIPLTPASGPLQPRKDSLEDDIRDKERAQSFDAEFVRLARAVYFENDERAAIKRRINITLGSSIVEEKSYKEYKP